MMLLLCEPGRDIHCLVYVGLGLQSAGHGAVSHWGGASSGEGLVGVGYRAQVVERERSSGKQLTRAGKGCRKLIIRMIHERLNGSEVRTTPQPSPVSHRRRGRVGSAYAPGRGRAPAAARRFLECHGAAGVGT